MNIGIDIRALSSPAVSGVGNYILGALGGLLTIDKNNQYYLFSSGMKKENFAWLPFQQHNVHYIHYLFPNKLLNLTILSPWPIDIIQKIPVKLDLFWLPNINFFKTKSPLPVVLTIHDLSFLQGERFYSYKRKIWHRAVALTRLINSAAKILVVSDNTKRDLVKFFSTNGTKIEVIRPGLNMALLNQNEIDNIAQSLALPEKYFLFVGTVEPRKNLSAVVQAFSDFCQDFPDYHLVIAGNRGWLYQPILKKIKDRPRIHYLDYVSAAQKNILYSRCQALIWPSFYEGYGFPPLEALYFQAPVITSYKTAMPEILKNKVLYIDPYNVADITRAMTAIVTDTNLITDLKKSAQAFVPPPWSQQALQILKLFTDLYKSHENSS